MVLTDCKTIVTDVNAFIWMIGYLHQHAGHDDICLKAMNILGNTVASANLLSTVLYFNNSFSPMFIYFEKN